MPLYDYKCNKCENVQEIQCKISEMDDPKTCSECGATEMVKVILSANHAFMAPEALGRKKAPQDFRDFLGAIHKAHGKDSQIRVR